MLEAPRFYKKDKKSGKAKNVPDMGVVHHSGLYDLDEDMAGEKTDLATGQKINNSTDDNGAWKFTKFKPNKKSKDLLPPLPKEKDEAAKWLREQGLL